MKVVIVAEKYQEQFSTSFGIKKQLVTDKETLSQWIWLDAKATEWMLQGFWSSLLSFDITKELVSLVWFPC